MRHKTVAALGLVMLCGPAGVCAPAPSWAAEPGPKVPPATPSDSSATGHSADDQVMVTPFAGVVAPLPWYSAPYPGQIGWGASGGASLGWMFDAVPLELALSGAYAAFWPGSVHTPSTSDPARIRTSRPEMTDWTVTGRVWLFERFLLDASAGVTSISIVQVRDVGVDPRRATSPGLFVADAPQQWGVEAGLGLGFVLGVVQCPLRDLLKWRVDRFDKTLMLSIDATVRSYTNEWLWTLPITLGVNI